jgi:DNA primase
MKAARAVRLEARVMIPQSFIQDLLNRVDIVGVIERYVPLKRAGANYVACCPFHSEKTPSFTVSASKQFYHCFGCGAHGTAVGFVMEYSGNGFVETVRELAQSVGMQVPDVKNDRLRVKIEEGDDPYEVLLKAAQYYRQQLKTAQHAIEYLKQRGLSGEIAKQFGIGYAPGDWCNLQSAFPDYEAKALVAAGLVVKGDNGKRYDRFRDRIMFPIIDVRGHIVGFGGRVLATGSADAAAQGSPKYLNSPETALFEKGRELYGLYQARRAIRDAERVVVVEGYMDVVALAQAGIRYAVATLGTATTPTHIQKLLRQTDEIVFCFDGDDAGRRAAWRALENSLDQLADGKQVSFLFLPQGEDPDTFVRKEGRVAFETLLRDAQPLSQFLLQELSLRVDLNTNEGRARLLKEAQPLITRIQARFLNSMIRQNLVRLAGITAEELDRVYGSKPHAPRAALPRAAAERVRGPERMLVELLVLRPDLGVLVERSALAGARGVTGIDQREIEFLDQLLEAFAQSPAAKVGEYFRDTHFEALAQEVETALLTRPEAGFQSDELEAQLLTAWQSLRSKIQDGVRGARLKALQDRQQKQNLSPEEQSEYKELMRPSGTSANR